MWQKAIAGLDIAKKSYDRMQALFKKGVISAKNAMKPKQTITQ